MALLGQGVAAIWHDIAPDAEADYHHWHCHEHIPERIRVPGFLRGRRYVVVSGRPRFFHFYETESLATLTSPTYLERLNDPTPWTRRVVGHFRGTNRTLSRVVASFGLGVGAAVLAARIGTAPERGAELEGWLTADLLPELVTRAGIVGAHLLRGDEAASRTETQEKAMRDRPDEIADRVVLIEAIEPDLLVPLEAGELAPAALAALGAASAELAIYRLHFALTGQDLGTRRA